MSYKRVRGNLRPEYLRLKEAMTVFSMGPEKIESRARECGAYYKVDKVVLINYEALRDCIETFREINGLHIWQKCRKMSTLGIEDVISVDNTEF